MARHGEPIFSVLFVVLLMLQGCSLGKPLQAHTADPGTIAGTFDLILHGCRYPTDYETAAFLISSEAKYPINLVVFKTAYKEKKGLQAKQALEEADRFVRCGINTVTETRVQKIPDDGGGTIGYEILPRYSVTDASGSDPLIVNYSLKEGTVNVYIRINPELERKINSVSGPSGGGR